MNFYTLVQTCLRKPIFLWGMGKSNEAVAKFLEQSKKNFSYWDDDPKKLLGNWNYGRPSCHVEKNSWVIVSPGIPWKDRKKEFCPDDSLFFLCDIQLFFYLFPHLEGIGVTGTFGKSTTCSLLEWALKKLGKAAIVTGNIGLPIFETLNSLEDFHNIQKILYIVECSSYQLELCDFLPFKRSILLNCVPHHLERHGTMENYFAAKLKIAQHSECFFLPHDLAGTLGHLKKNWIVFEEESFTQCWAKVLLKSYFWQHEKVLNFLSNKDFFKDVPPLPHRLALVQAHENIIVFNDSKATTPHAACYALRELAKRYPDYKIMWIVGGVLQEDQLDVFLPLLPCVEKAFCIGQAAERYDTFFKKYACASEKSGTLSMACQHVQDNLLQHRKEKFIILLSPACASFDEFRDYQERGEKFEKWMHAMLFSL